MAKKSTPVEKAARMLDLVPFISAHQGIEISKLASEFGISEEELMSDLNSLWMCGDSRFDLIDLQFDSGYVTIRNAESLNLIRSLSQQEIISILIGLGLIEKNLPQDRIDVVSDISSLRKKLGDGLSKILTATPSIDASKVQEINEAIRSHQRILIEYFSPTDDEISERLVTPLSVLSEDNREFLKAFCHSAQAHRTFRIDRIQNLKRTEIRSEEISLEISEPSRNTETVKILRNHRRSREALGTHIQGDGDEVKVSSFSSDWLSRTVISAAGAIQVTTSSGLRQQICSRVEETLQEYR